jgi:hypothetical protein
MRVRVLFLTSGIRIALFCSLNISCSFTFYASLGPQSTVGTSAVIAHHSSPAQTSSNSSEAVSSSRSRPPLARHVRRTVSALGRLERATQIGGRGCHGRETRASGGRDCNDGGKTGDGETGSSKSRSRSSSGGGWLTLTKTNYVEWAAVMKVRLQVRHMWEAVRYGDVDYYEDRRALDALIIAVPPEIQFSLFKKWTAKEAWDTIAAARISSDRARKTTLQALRNEWENLTFKPGEDINDFALYFNTLQ